MSDEVSINFAEMDKVYTCDVVLRRLGYTGRTYVSEGSQNTFLHMLAMSHINYYLNNTAEAVHCTESLMKFSEAGVQAPVSDLRQIMSWIGEQRIASEDLQDFRNLEYYMKPYCDIGLFYSGGEESQSDEVIQRLSEGLGVHIVIMQHAEESVICHPFFVSTHAPIVHIETFNGMFCALMPIEKEDFPVHGTREEILSAYSGHISRIPPELVKEREGMLLKVIEEQKQFIERFISCVKGKTFISEAIESLNRLQAIMQSLGMDSDFYTNLKDDVSTLSLKQLLQPEPAPQRVVASDDLMPPQRVLCPRANPSVHTVASPSQQSSVSPLRGQQDATVAEVPRQSRYGEMTSPTRGRRHTPPGGKGKRRLSHLRDKSCSQCHRRDVDIYNDGPHLPCYLCFQCAAGTAKCPVCKKDFTSSEIARFHLLTSPAQA